MNNMNRDGTVKVELSKEQICKFKHIYKNKLGVDISDKEALEHWLSLVNFMKLVVHHSKK